MSQASNDRQAYTRFVPDNALSAQLPAVIWTTDRDLRITACFGAGLRKIGLAPDASVGITLYDQFQTTDADFPPIQAHLDALEGRSARYEHTVSGQNHRVYIEPLRDQSQEIIGCIGIACDITDIQKAENERTHLSAIAASTSHAIFSATLDGTIMTWNSGAEILTGYSAEDMIGGSSVLLIPPGFEYRERELLAQINAEEHIDPFDAIWIRKDGVHIWVMVTVAPIRNGSGETSAVSVIAHDITRRRQYVETLQESEMLFRQIADTAPATIWIIDSDGFCTFISQNWLELTGQTPQDGLGAGWLNVIHPEDRSLARQNCLRATATYEHFQSEYRICRPDGEQRWVLDVGQPRFSENGNFLGFIGSMFDITERKQIEETKSRLAAIVEHSYDAIFTISPEETITSWNTAAERIFGYSAEEVLGSTIDFLTPPSFADEEVIIRSKLQQIENLFHHVTVGRTKAGNPIDLILTITSMRDSTGNLIGASVVASDITHQKREELLRLELAKQKEINDLKTRFTSMVSHEFRTPLATIQASSDILKHYGDRINEERRIAHLDKIQAHVKHLTDLLNDILALNRADSVGFEFHAERIDLPTLARDLVEEVELASDGANIQLSLNACSTLLGDARLISHIIINLLSNAVKYSTPGSPVELSITCEPRETIIRVTDHGIGIPEADQPYIFDTFRRAGNVGSTQGTGLGLAITKRAAESHGGTIAFQSAVNTGTTFVVSLPVLSPLDYTQASTPPLTPE